MSNMLNDDAPVICRAVRPACVPPLDMSKVAAQLALQARDASDASPRGRGGRNWPPKGGLAPTVLSARSSQREAEFCLEVDFDMSTLPPVQETGHLDQYAQPVAMAHVVIQSQPGTFAATALDALLCALQDSSTAHEKHNCRLSRVALDFRAWGWDAARAAAAASVQLDEAEEWSLQAVRQIKELRCGLAGRDKQLAQQAEELTGFRTGMEAQQARSHAREAQLVGREFRQRLENEALQEQLLQERSKSAALAGEMQVQQERGAVREGELSGQVCQQQLELQALQAQLLQEQQAWQQAQQEAAEQVDALTAAVAAAQANAHALWLQREQQQQEAAAQMAALGEALAAAEAAAMAAPAVLDSGVPAPSSGKAARFSCAGTARRISSAASGLVAAVGQALAVSAAEAASGDASGVQQGVARRASVDAVAQPDRRRGAVAWAMRRPAAQPKWRQQRGRQQDMISDTERAVSAGLEGLLGQGCEHVAAKAACGEAGRRWCRFWACGGGRL